MLLKKPQLKELYNLITPSYAASWKEIGSQLGIQKGILQTIELKFSPDVEKCCDEMLEEWLDADNTAAWNKLIQVISSPTVAEIIDGLPFKAVAKMECKLKENHIVTRYRSPEESWFSEPKHFTSVALIHQKRRKTKREIIAFANLHHKGDFTESGIYSTLDCAEVSKVTTNIADIFSPVESTGNPYTLLIEGAPGIGKTILSKEIVFQWANGNLLNNARLVFLIYLRDPKAKKITTFKSLVGYISYLEVSKSIEKYISDKSGKGITLIFDGFDEYPEKLRTNSYLSDVINHKVFELQLCNIIVTSRPNASACLHNNIDLRVEILGFTKKHRKSYITDALKGNDKAIKDLLEYLENTYSVDAYCHIPLSMAILVFLFEDCNYNINKLPATQTAINYMFICITIRRFINNSQQQLLSIQNLSEVPVSHKQILLDISKLAFRTLKYDEIVFTASDIRDLCPSLLRGSKNQHGLDLLKAVQYNTFDKNANELSFNFLHFSVQELLATYHITLMSEAQQIRLLKDTFWNSRYFNVWIMYVALTKDQPFAFKHFLSGNWLRISTRFSLWWSRNTYTSISNNMIEDKIKCLHLFQCFTEAGNDDMCRYVSKLLQDGTIDLSGRVLSAVDLYTLSCFLARCVRRQWKLLDLSNCHLDDENFETFCKSYASLTKSTVYVDTINLSCNSFTQLSASHIASLILNFNGKYLIVDSNKIEDIGIDGATFSSFLSHSNLAQTQLIKIEDEYQAILFLYKKSFAKVNASELLIMLCCTKETYRDVSMYITNNNLLFEKFLKTDTMSTFETMVHRLINKMSFFSTNFKLNIKGRNFTMQKITSVISGLTSSFPLALCVGDNSLPLQLCNVSSNPGDISKLLNSSGTILFCGNLSAQLVHSLFCLFLAKNSLTKIYLNTISLYDYLITDISCDCSAISCLQLINCCTHINTSVTDVLSQLINKATSLELLKLSGCRFKNADMLIISKILKQTVTLKTIAVSNTILSKDVSDIIASVITCNKSIQGIELSFCSLQEEAILTITKALEINIHLESLDLSNNVITNKPAFQIAMIIKYHSVKVVKLKNCKLQSAGLRRITEAMITKTCLHCIDLSSNVVSEQNAMLIATVILNNRNIRHLNFSNCKLENIGCQQLFQSLTTVKSLEYLDLHNNVFTDFVIAMFSLLINQNTTLEHLNISGCFNEMDFKIVTKSLMSLKSLCHLDLSSNIVNVASAENVAAVISNNPYLEEFYFPNCKFHKSTFSKIITAMQSSHYLKGLYLDSNSVSSEDSKMIANLISNNPYLEKVDLSSCNLTNEGMNNILMSLRNHSTLKYFDISSNEISNHVVNKVADVIDGNTQLTHLNISDSKIQEYGLLKIFKAAKRIYTLKSIKLCNCTVSDQAIQVIADAISVNHMMEEVVFANNDFHETGIGVILDVLKQAHMLKIMIISSNSVISNVTGIITEVIVGNCITHFSLSCCDLQRSSCSSILHTLLLQTPGLQYIDLSGNNLNHNALTLARLISGSCYLQHLNVAHTSMQDDEVMVIVKAMQCINSLCYVDLTSYRINNELILELQGMIGENPTMTSIQISDLCIKKVEGTLTNFNKDVFEMLFNLKHISIDFSVFENNEADAALIVIKNSPLLQYLHLESYKLLEINIGNVITRITTINYFCLINIVITDEVEDGVISVLENNFELKHFKLVGCKLPESGLLNCFRSFNMTRLSYLVLREMDNLISYTSRPLKSQLCGSLIHLSMSNVHLDTNRLSCLSFSFLTKLKHLNLSHNPITDQGADILSTLIVNNNGLKHLDLCNCNLQSEGIRVVINSLQATSVIYLDVSLNTIDTNIMPLLSSLKSIEHLCLPYYVMKQYEIDKIHDIVSIFLHLKYIDVGPTAIPKWMINDFNNILLVIKGNKHISFDTEGIKQINLLSNVSKNLFYPLHYLNISNIIVNNETENLINILIANSPNLEHIEMAGIIWNFTCVTKCFTALQNCKKLLHLNLSNSSCILAEMFTSLGCFTALESLNLHNCRLKDIGTVSVVLKDMGIITMISITNLIYLDLSSNLLDDEAVGGLAIVIATNVRLKYLNLCKCNLTSYGMEIIINVLKFVQSLKFLDFSFNEKVLKDELLMTLLSSNKHLEQLRLNKVVLSNTKITQAKCNLLVLKGLQKLSINNCFITDGDVGNIISLIVNNPKLHELCLLECEISVNSKVMLSYFFAAFDSIIFTNSTVDKPIQNSASVSLRNTLNDIDVVAVMTVDNYLGEFIMYKLVLNQNTLKVLSANTVTIRGLKILQIRNCTFTDYYAYYVAYIITINAVTIWSFSLITCKMSIKQRMIIYEALFKLNVISLRNIRITDNSVAKHETTKNVKYCFDKTNCKLTDDIITAVMTDNVNLKISNLIAGLVEIRSNLHLIKGLIHLNINHRNKSNNKVYISKSSDKDDTIMATVVANNKYIKEFHLSCFPFSQSYVETLKNLSILSSLESLSLINVTIGMYRENLITVIIDNNPRLRLFAISMCRVDEIALVKIIYNIAYRLKNLLYINFSHIIISGDAVNHIVAVIACNTQLKYINLSNCRLLATGIKRIIQAARSMITLEYFDLSCNYETGVVINDIVTLIKNNKKISVLSLPKYTLLIRNNHFKVVLITITDLLVNDIANLIASNGEIVALSLLNCTLNNDQVKILNTIKECSKITYMNVNVSEVNDEPITDIVSVVENDGRIQNLIMVLKLIVTQSMLQHLSCVLQFRGIRHLTIIGCTFHYKEWNILKQLVAIGDNNYINTLIVSDCHLYGEISEIVKSCRKLCHLDLANVNIVGRRHNFDLKACQQIVFKSKIRSFSLNNMNFTKHIAVDILRIVYNCINLEHFALFRCNFDRYLNKSLWKVILSCKCLSHIDISYSKITGEIAACILTYSKNLTHIKMASCDFDVEGLSLICNALLEYSNIVHLNLNNNKNICYWSREMAVIIRQNKNIRHIEMAACDFDCDGILRIWNSISFCNTLRCVNLSLNNIRGCIKTVVFSLSLMKCLECIYLQKCGLKSTDCKYIIAALGNISSLRSVDLSLNEMEEDSAVYITKLLATNKNIEVLCLPDCKSTIVNGNIIKSLQKFLSLLQILHLGSIEISTELVNIINNHQKLKQLRFSKLFVGQQGFEESSKSDWIMKLKGIEELNITGTTFTVQSVKKLTLLLGNNPTIQSVNFGCCVIPFINKMELFSLLASFESLQSFNICGVTIETQLEDQLAAMLSRKVMLKHLEVAECKLSNSGIRKLLEAISNLTKLHLDISGNLISTENVTVLVDIIKYSTAIDELKMSSCNITDIYWILTLLSLKNLKYLDLSHNPVILTRSCEVEQRSKSLENDTLQYLSLFNCGLSAQCTRKVIKQLRSFSSLQCLNLGLNTVDVYPAVVNDITTIVSSNQQMSNFSLPSCLLSNDMMTCILDSIKGVKSLRHIDFSTNQVNDSLADDVAALKASCDYLVELKFSEMVLTHVGFTQLGNSILIIHGLNNISITGVQFIDTNTYNLITLITNNKQLQVLDISDCVIPELKKHTLFIAMIDVISLKSFKLNNIVISGTIEDQVLAVLANNVNLEYLEIIGCKMNTARLNVVISNFDKLKVLL